MNDPNKNTDHCKVKKRTFQDPTPNPTGIFDVFEEVCVFFYARDIECFRSLLT